MISPKTQAIHAALSQNWDDAVNQNLMILSVDPNDLEALNRLAYAYIQLGSFTRARSICRKVLALDRYNAIASKNLQKIKLHTPTKAALVKISPSLFLEEPGRTKMVSLINVAPSRTLYSLSIGEPVVFIIKRHTLEVRSAKKVYLGVLPDDLGFRLRRLILSGNRYEVFVKSIGKNSLSIFIKEIKRSKRFKNQPTFPANGDMPIYSFVRRDLSVDEELSTGETGEDEDSDE